jgi:hypothetical protein
MGVEFLAAVGLVGHGLLAVHAPRRVAGPEAPAAFALQVRSKNPMALEALREAGRDAAARLADPACSRVFSELKDAAGRTLKERLDALGRSGVAQLQSIYFYDGANRSACQRRRTLAVTEPGSVVVHVCPEFVRRQRQDPAAAPVALIHELLHTLGLGENPPSSEAITRHVRTRCGN